MRVVWLVLGMVLLVVGAQGAIRLLVDHNNAGLLGLLPGGFAVQLTGYLVITTVGIVLAARNAKGVVPADDRRTSFLIGAPLWRRGAVLAVC